MSRPFCHFFDVWVGLRVALGRACVGSGAILPVVWPDEWPTDHLQVCGVVLVGWMGFLLVALIGVGCVGLGCVALGWAGLGCGLVG